MHQTFDSNVSRADQIIRVANMKCPGRKHQHRPGNKVKQRIALAAKRNAAKQLRKRRVRNAQVAAYFRGERDTYPR